MDFRAPEREFSRSVESGKQAAPQGSTPRGLTMYIPERETASKKSARLRSQLLFVAASLCGIGAIALRPRAIEAELLLTVQDDPAALAVRKLERSFTSEILGRSTAVISCQGDCPSPARTRYENESVTESMAYWNLSAAPVCGVMAHCPSRFSVRRNN
jgi:hypothetical protein